MKIFVATPVFDGKLQVQTVSCLIQEQTIAMVNGDELQFHFLPACSHPAMGRNQLAEDFMKSDCERLIFLDADITFEMGALLKIAHHKTDFVGGCFRYKTEPETYPIGWLEGQELWANEQGLIAVKSLPGGFLSLSRKVFETHRERFPDHNYEHFGRTAHCYFQMPFKDGHLRGEDSFFCEEWRDSGGQVFLDPEIALTHWDFNRPYIGHIGNWLKNRSSDQQQKDL